MKRFDIVCLGELLVDFTPYGASDAGMRLFEQNAGGAPGNVAAAMAKLGHSAAFIGKVGEDINGRFLRQTLENADVDTSGLLTDAKTATSMAFVALSPDGERDFSFVRDADTKLCADELNAALIEHGRIFHFGSLSLTHEPVRGATLRALKIAREAGCIISYDPNYRAPLWESERVAVEAMRSMLPMADILKVSEEEAFLLTGKEGAAEGGMDLLARGPLCVAVTQGGKGATLCLPSGCVHVPTCSGPVADTTGAGDAFTGGLLSGLLTRGLHPRELTQETVVELSRFAHAVATCSVAKRGAIPAMPSREQALAVMNKGEDNHETL